MIFSYHHFCKPFSGENRALPDYICPLAGEKLAFGGESYAITV